MAGAISFDLFGTLVAVEPRGRPAHLVADELRERGVTVPGDWEEAYVEPHVATEAGEERSLVVHVRAALASRGVVADAETVERAVRAAFDADVRTRAGAIDALDACERPVGLLSNCSVPGLVERTLERSAIDPGTLDAVVTSVGCGWRKPDQRAFEAVARALDVPLSELVHVGDDPRTDGGAEDAGATALLLEHVSLDELPAALEGMP